MSALLHLDDVACIRGERMLFERLSLEIGCGAALWLRGPNGVGKSSLIRLAAGLLQPAAGTVTRSGPCALIDEASALDPELPLARALAFWAAVDGVEADTVMAAMAAMALTALHEVPVAMLSTGQRKRAGVARVIASASPLWLLDEPANGLDDAARARLVTAIAAHRADGGAVLLASHQSLGLDNLDELDMGATA